MRSDVQRLKEQVTELTAQMHTLQAEHTALQSAYDNLQIENNFLRQQNVFLRRQMFGRKSEKLDRNQLELLLNMQESAFVVESQQDDDDDPPPGGRRKRRGGERKVKIPEGTPTQEVIIDPPEVEADPKAYQCIGEEVTRELDVVPHPYVLRLIRRRKYKSKTDRTRPPLLAPAPPRLIENSLATPGLLTDIILKRCVEHLPLYRQEQVLKSRYGIEISRKTMCDWVGIVAGWLKPIYNHMRKELQKSEYLQIDETPVQYLGAEGGGSAQGYLWVYHRPGGDVLYEWHRGRGANCLEEMLGDFQGTVQCDGYSAYTSYTKDKSHIDLAGCWAHARRYFFDAQAESRVLAGWVLHQIGLLYRIEADLRDRGAGPALRQAVRSSQSAMILARIEKALRRKLTHHLPKSSMGEAIGYTLSQWDRLMAFVSNGKVEIDNNRVENAIRPTAIGKKNWLFFGAPNSGERSAILYTVLESCKRRGINQGEYLREVLSRLPSMMITETARWTPAAWENRHQRAVA